MRDLGDPPSGDGTDPASLARRIERLARSGEAGFVPLAERLQGPLQALLGTDTTLVLRALHDLHHAVADAQCREPLAPWLRWLAPARGVVQRFQSDCREAMACHARVLERARRLAQAHQPGAADAATDLDRLGDAADRLGPALHEAQSLLARLWERLMPQRPDPADARSLQALRALLAEVDGVRALLQRLEQACASARDVVRLGRAVLDGRGELLVLADGRFGRAWDDWSARIDPLLRGGIQAGQLVAGARDATASRRGLLLALEQLRGVCTRLQIDEQALAHALAQLREQLKALQPAQDGARAAERADPPVMPGP